MFPYDEAVGDHHREEYDHEQVPTEGKLHWERRVDAYGTEVGGILPAPVRL